VILAAGLSTRTGAQKLLMPFRGRPMIECAIEAAAPWNPVIVTGADVARALEGKPYTVVLNDAPEKGMAHSLRLADTAVPQGESMIVLLADKPLVTTEIIGQVLSQRGDADVAYPVRPSTGEPGHPVIFSAHARTKIAALADGDTLRELRDDASLERHVIEMEDAAPFFDVDTREAFGP